MLSAVFLWTCHHAFRFVARYLDFLLYICGFKKIQTIHQIQIYDQPMDFPILVGMQTYMRIFYHVFGLGEIICHMRMDLPIVIQICYRICGFPTIYLWICKQTFSLFIIIRICNEMFGFSVTSFWACGHICRLLTIYSDLQTSYLYFLSYYLDFLLHICGFANRYSDFVKYICGFLDRYLDLLLNFCNAEPGLATI